MLLIRSFSLPPVQTNAYLLSDASIGRAVLIDAPQGVWETIAPILEAEQLKLEQCVLTHAHFDHVLGAAALNEQAVPLCLHRLEAPMLASLEGQIAFFGMEAPVHLPTIDVWLEDGAVLECLDRKVELRRVPGHAEGHCLFYLPGEEVAFVGDALFAGSVGRTDLPGGDFEVLSKAIKEQIYSLPGTTTLYSGHGPKTTVAQEMATNPFVRGEG